MLSPNSISQKAHLVQLKNVLTVRVNEKFNFLAIAMVEMDTGIELSSEERKAMADRILAKIKGFE